MLSRPNVEPDTCCMETEEVLGPTIENKKATNVWWKIVTWLG